MNWNALAAIGELLEAVGVDRLLEAGVRDAAATVDAFDRLGRN
jgi:hypothetical protein